MNILCWLGFHKWLYYKNEKGKRCCYRCFRKERLCYYGGGGTEIMGWEKSWA